MELRVRQVCQSGSGGSYLVMYQADLALCDGGVSVDVRATAGDGVNPETVAQAVQAIQQGAETVLAVRGLGAHIRIENLVIHPTDFKPDRYRQFTAEAVAQLLQEPV